MRRVVTFVAVLSVVLTARTVFAQDPPAAPPKSNPVATIGKAVIDSFSKPLHPVVKSVAPGGGFGLGIGYRTLGRDQEQWFTTTDAVVTPKLYWLAEIDSALDTDRTHVEAYGRIRNMRQLDFFGLGPSSSLNDRADFALREAAVGGLTWFRPERWFALGGRVEELWPHVAQGHASDVPSVGQRFSAAALPGLLEQPRFGHYQVFVDLNYPAPLGFRPAQGIDAEIGYGVFHDQELGRYTFRRLDLEAQQRITVLDSHHAHRSRLTLHALLSATDTSAGNDAPFYLQQTLGGADNLRGFREAIIGSDDTAATLRGFRDFRFRDRNLLLLQAEYRAKIWEFVDGSVFVDGGKVAAKRSDLDLADLRHDYGVAISLMRGDMTALRVDVGFGGGEGHRVFVSLGRALAP